MARIVAVIALVLAVVALSQCAEEKKDLSTSSSFGLGYGLYGGLGYGHGLGLGLGYGKGLGYGLGYGGYGLGGYGLGLGYGKGFPGFGYGGYGFYG